MNKIFETKQKNEAFPFPNATEVISVSGSHFISSLVHAKPQGGSGSV